MENDENVLVNNNSDSTGVRSWVDSGFQWLDKGTDILGKVRTWGSTSSQSETDVDVSVGAKNAGDDKILGMNKTLAIALIAIVSLTVLGFIVKAMKK